MNGLSHSTIWLVIAGMAAVNFAMRFVPLALVSRIDVPPTLKRWLSFVPVSVMGALVASEVLLEDGHLAPPLQNAGILASVLTMVVFRLTRSFLGATLAGMVSYVLLTTLMG